MIVQAPEVFLDNPKVIKLSNLSILHYFNAKVSEKIDIQINEHMLLHLFSGSKVIDVKGVGYPVTEGESVFLSKNQALMCEMITFEESESHSSSFGGAMIYFDDLFLVSFFNKYPHVFEKANVELAQDDICVAQKSEALNNSFLSMDAYFKTNVNSETLLRLKFEEILLQFLDNDSSEELSSYLKSLYTKGVFSFRNMYDKGEFSTVEEMIQMSKLSEDKFRKFFFQVYKTTPKEWLIKRSLIKAKRLLEDGNMNVSEVSTESGFNSLSWFIQVFKNTYGKTPKRFQQDYVKGKGKV